jgi:hypothetical protein
MKKQESAKLATRSGRLRRHNRLRRLHRWFGLAALLFILLLSLTGIGLNHSDDLRLDSRHLNAPWLLAWYGFEVPEPEISFAAAEHRITLLGNRLYLDAEEAVRGVSELVGAVAWDNLTVAASAESLFYLSAGGELLDRLELGTELPGAMQALGVARGRLVVRSAGQAFEFDERTLGTVALPADSGADVVRWSQPSALPATLGAAIERSYRGPGVSVERLLYDLHNGRLFARAGVWILDAAGVVFIALSVTGLVLWIKRRS